VVHCPITDAHQRQGVMPWPSGRAGVT
jgi:hypothetical protein